MSVRDADLCESLLHRLSTLREGQPLRVVEWGAGRSTLWYTQFLTVLEVPFRWLAIEHDREFFESTVGPELCSKVDARVLRCEALTDQGPVIAEHLGVTAVIFDAGPLLPFEAGHEADRLADLDDYVALPRRLGLQADVVVVDGRKRRRCLLEAAELLSPDGHVVLHDAFRPYYQSAWSHFASGRRFGDEWWIGSLRPTDFLDVLPEHAFERHVAEPPSEATLRASHPRP